MPTSKAVFLILWLYSVEPPLYFHFNTACRDRNNKLLPLLGPFAKATGVILEGWAEENRGDGFKIGMSIDYFGKGPLGKMAGAFVVFRGAQLPLHVVNRYALIKGRRWFNQTQMVGGQLKGRTNLNEGLEPEEMEWVDLPANWKEMAGYVCLPGAQSTSVSFKVALEFAFGSSKT